MKKHRTVAAMSVAGLAVVPLLATAGAASGSPAAPAAAPSQAALGPDTVNWAAENAVDQLADAAKTQLADQFGDVVVHPDSGTVEVWRTGLPAAAEQALENAHPGKFVFHAARHTQGEAMAAQERISGSLHALKAQGIQLHALKPQPDGSLEVTVGLQDGESLADATAAINNSAAFDAVTVTAEPVVPANTNTWWTAYRYADTPGFNGGDLLQGADQIHPGGHTNCTSGIPMHNTSTGTYYLLVAAHCFSPFGETGSSTASTNNYHDIYGVHGSGTAIGNVCHSEDVSSGTTYDAALICVSSSSDFIFSGAWNSASKVTQYGAVSGNYDGDPVCLSGGYDGNRCNGTIVGHSITNCSIQPYGCQHFLVQVNANAGTSMLGGPGDSGGAVYKLDTSTGMAKPLGFIDSGVPAPAAQYTCDMPGTIDNTGNRYGCEYQMYYEALDMIEANLWTTITPNT